MSNPTAYNRAAWVKKMITEGRLHTKKTKDGWQAMITSLTIGTITCHRDTEHAANTAAIEYLDQRKLIDWQAMEVL